MLRKKRRISESLDDDPMSGLSNLSDAMLVLALGFLIFAFLWIYFLRFFEFLNFLRLKSVFHKFVGFLTVKFVSSADTFEQNYTDAGGMEYSGYSEVGKVYEDPTTGKLVLVSG